MDLAAAAVLAAPVCDGSTGLVAPQPSYGFNPPVCSGSGVDDGPPMSWVDPVTGGPRAACVFRPPATSRRGVPLVIALHPYGHSAGWVYTSAQLRMKAAGASPFVLASDQGRVLYNAALGYGAGHDTFYRDFSSPSTNPDFRALDYLIDSLVAGGGIDPKRIYAIGWSNGGFFSAEYAIARHVTSTPGGNRVAAAAVYAGGNPYDNTSDTQTPSCAESVLPTTSLPIYIIHRSCDTRVACDKAQWTAAGLTYPGAIISTWRSTLRTTMGDANIRSVMIDDSGVTASACAAAASCSAARGQANHLNWPDGINDGSGNDWEPAILDFLFKHRLGGPRD